MDHHPPPRHVDPHPERRVDPPLDRGDDGCGERGVRRRPRRGSAGGGEHEGVVPGRGRCDVLAVQQHGQVQGDAVLRSRGLPGHCEDGEAWKRRGEVGEAGEGRRTFDGREQRGDGLLEHLLPPRVIERAERAVLEGERVHRQFGGRRARDLQQQDGALPAGVE